MADIPFFSLLWLCKDKLQGHEWEMWLPGSSILDYTVKQLWSSLERVQRTTHMHVEVENQSAHEFLHSKYD